MALSGVAVHRFVPPASRLNAFPGKVMVGFVVDPSTTPYRECRTPSRPIGYYINFLISRNWRRGVAWWVVRERPNCFPQADLPPKEGDRNCGIRELEGGRS